MEKLEEGNPGRYNLCWPTEKGGLGTSNKSIRRSDETRTLHESRPVLGLGTMLDGRDSLSRSGPAFPPLRVLVLFFSLLYVRFTSLCLSVFLWVWLFFALSSILPACLPPCCLPVCLRLHEHVSVFLCVCVFVCMNNARMPVCLYTWMDDDIHLK